VKEQSHKDEMSAALRGDFQRLRERGVAASLAPPKSSPAADAPVEKPKPSGPEDPVEPVVTPAAAEALSSSETVSAAETISEPETMSAPEAPQETADDADPERPGWLVRLLGR
jgi:hypothetical protein